MAIVFTISGGLLTIVQFGLRQEHKRAVEEPKQAAEFAQKSFDASQLAAADAEKDRAEIAKLLSDAKAKHKSITQHVKTMRELGSTLMATKEDNLSPELEKVKTAARAVASSEESPMHERLYASGLDAVGKSEWPRAAAFFAAADASKPNNAETLLGWGVAFGKQAVAAEGEVRARLLSEAISKFEAALKINSDMDIAFNCWSTALLLLAQDAGETKRTQLVDLVDVRANQAVSISGAANYNQACVAAIRGNAARFVEIADSLRAGALPDKAHIDADNDLDGIRKTPEFQAWYARTFSGNTP
jgi:hypothetical protein